MSPEKLREQFTACHSRVERSREHFQTLTDELGAAWTEFDRGELHSIVEEVDIASGYSIQRLRIVKHFPLARWGILVDIVHEARSALDNLIEVLNFRSKGHATTGTAFPICKDKKGFQKKGKPKMGSVGDEAAEIVESLQPYHRGDQYALHPLWILHALWNRDKHRQQMLAIVVAHTDDIGLQWRATSGTATMSRPHIVAPQSFPFEDGAEVCRVLIERRSPNAEVFVNATYTLQVAIGEGQPAALHAITPVLGGCIDSVEQAFLKFSKFF